MAVITHPGWLQNAGAVHTAAELRTYLSAMQAGNSDSATSLVARGGVHPSLGGELEVTENTSPDMNVRVASGIASIPGTENSVQGNYFVGNDATVTLSIAAADGTNPRIDLVVFNVRDSFYSGADDDAQLQVLTGTPASTPAEPTVPDNAIVLARVDVAAGETSIEDADITDRRHFNAALGGFINCLSTNRPASPDIAAGQVLYETDTGRWVGYDGTDYFSFGGQGYQFLQTVIFTSSGSFSKGSYPNIRAVRVRGVGGGGGAGGADGTSSTEASAAGGGGGGGYGEKFILASALASSETVTVGAGGTAGGSGATSGGNGVSSSFGAHVTFGGGNTGEAGNASATTFVANRIGGAGGIATGADLSIRGTDGGNATIGGSDHIYFMQSTGGASFLSGTQSGNASDTGDDGVAGNLYGGGAAGAYNRQSQAARSGAAGADGIVIVDVYV